MKLKRNGSKHKMADKTQEEWKKMSWNDKVTDRVNEHHDRLAAMEKKLDEFMANPTGIKLKTVNNLLGNLKDDVG